jgi:hypothetical protein
MLQIRKLNKSPTFLPAPRFCYHIRFSQTCTYVRDIRTAEVHKNSIYSIFIHTNQSLSRNFHNLFFSHIIVQHIRWLRRGWKIFKFNNIHDASQYVEQKKIYSR